MSFTEPQDPYPEIGQILVRSTPRPWDRIVLVVRLWEGAARFTATKYDDDRSVGVRLSDVSRLRHLFERVQEITQEVGAPKTSRWETATFTLKSDGDFDIDFGYDDGDGVGMPLYRRPRRPPRRRSARGGSSGAGSRGN